jgi:hypothetical protein
MKLHLDTLVIQQGRLVEQSQGPNKDELLNIIRFGANEIINATGSDMTDEDIDRILSKGQERTEQMNEKFKSKADSLFKFSLNGGGGCSTLVPTTARGF